MVTFTSVCAGDYLSAIDAYGQSLSVSVELGDAAMEAQASFSLGNTYMLMKDYDRATDYLSRHLKIAEDLNDKVIFLLQPYLGTVSSV